MKVSAERRPAGGLSAVLAATAFAGVAGYAIQLLAGALLPDARAYLAFSVFWATMYLFGGAVGGVQHELARATHPQTEPLGRGDTARRFAVAAAGVVALSAVALSLPLSSAAFTQSPVALSAAFVVGMVGYVLTSILTGILYGIGRLGPVAGLIVVDAAMRSLAVTFGILLAAPIEWLAFAIVMPFGASVALVWIAVRSRVVGSYRLDVGTRQLARNSLRTVGASSSIGIMVAGLPLLFNIFLPDATTVVASLIFVVTLTRAPLIIPLMALQSYLVVFFRDAGGNRGRRLAQALGGLLLVATICTVLGTWLVPGVIDLIASGRYSVDALTAGAVIASAALVGLMCVTSAALLATDRHNAYLIGWMVAALVTVGCLWAVPADVLPRAIIALLGGPLAGIVLQLLMTGRSRAEKGALT